MFGYPLSYRARKGRDEKEVSPSGERCPFQAAHFMRVRPQAAAYFTVLRFSFKLRAPQGGAIPRRMRRCRPFSIHAPARRNPPAHEKMPPFSFPSTRPQEAIPRRMRRYCLFLSIHAPARGDPAHEKMPPFSFPSTRPQGAILRRMRRCRPFSIHAPARRRDEIGGHAFPAFGFQSTQPRKERDICDGLQRMPRYIAPTSPRKTRKLLQRR